MPSGQSRRFLGLMALFCLATAGCTHPPKGSTTESLPPLQAVDEDPLEPLNRGIYKFNYVVDGVVLKPVTQIYRGVVPEPGQRGVSNFLANLYTPVTMVDSILQADPQNSFASLWRFILNTTFGFGGIYDFASSVGLKNRPADLGETFAFYGAGTGPFIELPIIGPSNGRDALGRLGDAFINPFNYISTGTSVAIWSATAIDQRSKNMKLLDTVYDTSLDPYATFRSGYTQKRAAEIKRAKAERDKALENAACTR